MMLVSVIAGVLFAAPGQALAANVLAITLASQAQVAPGVALDPQLSVQIPVIEVQAQVASGAVAVETPVGSVAASDGTIRATTPVASASVSTTPVPSAQVQAPIAGASVEGQAVPSAQVQAPIAGASVEGQAVPSAQVESPAFAPAVSAPRSQAQVPVAPAKKPSVPAPTRQAAAPDSPTSTHAQIPSVTTSVAAPQSTRDSTIRVIRPTPQDADQTISRSSSRLPDFTPHSARDWMLMIVCLTALAAAAAMVLIAAGPAAMRKLRAPVTPAETALAPAAVH